VTRTVPLEESIETVRTTRAEAIGAKTPSGEYILHTVSPGAKTGSFQSSWPRLAIRQQSQTIQFRSAAEMLESFGMQQGGTQYRRLVGAFQRIFGATIFFGTDTQRDRVAVVQQARFNFMSEARIWYSRDADQATLPGGFQNEIVLSHEFFKEIMSHPIPTDMEAAKALSCSPAALDLFMWLSYRCFVAKGRERVPLLETSGW
jgi:hypothetical protein